jgi:hypothetical protein
MVILLIRAARGPIVPTEFIPLAILELLAFGVFAAIGWIVAFVPARFAARRVRSSRHATPWCLVVGAGLGAAATPLSAAVPFYLSYLMGQDSPTYVDRLWEYIAPMAVAGIAGGLSYRGCASKADPIAEAADVF